MGFRSGEYFGRKISLAPAERMSRRTGFPFVATEIVHDHDVTGSQEENPFEVGLEALAVDRTVENPWCVNPVAT
jgi:hypothetical protein